MRHPQALYQSKLPFLASRIVTIIYFLPAPAPCFLSFSVNFALKFLSVFAFAFASAAFDVPAHPFASSFSSASTSARNRAHLA